MDEDLIKLVEYLRSRPSAEAAAQALIEPAHLHYLMQFAASEGTVMHKGVEMDGPIYYHVYAVPDGGTP